MNRFIEKIKKLTPSILPFVFGFVLIFMPIIAGAEEPAQQLGFFQRLFGRVGDTVADVLLFIPGWLSIVILQIANLLLSLAGLLLNFIVKYTIVNMAHNIGAAGINIEGPWSTIRDVVNMGFIFILLYAGIMTIIGKEKDTKRVIVNVVVAAILINFSMFFTKLVIDAANLIAVFFYDAIAPGATADVYTRGLSNSLMDPLRITTLAKDVGMLDGTTAIVVGVMGTIFVLIATFVLFAMCVMLVIRFVVLIFTIILSPIAFLSAVLPQTEKYRKQWWDALSGQAFFAPIFFLMIWIVIAVSRGLVITTEGEGGALGAVISGSFVEEGRSIGTNIGSMEASIGLVFNFVVIIALLIAAMIISKEWANKAGPTITGMTKWAMGAAGGASFGMAGRFGRNLVGSRAAEMASDEDLKKKAREGSIRARLQLAAANKAAKSSFDIRGSAAGGVLGAGKAKTGGFVQDQKDRQKTYETYKSSKEDIEEAKKKEGEAKAELEHVAEREIPKTNEHKEAEQNLKELENGPIEGLSDDAILARKERIEAARKRLSKFEQELLEKRKEFIETNSDLEELRKKRNELIEKRLEMEEGLERMAQKMESHWFTGGIFPTGGLLIEAKQKAKAMRDAAKGKSREQKIADLVAEGEKEKNEEKKKSSSETSSPESTKTEAPKTETDKT